MFGSDVAFNKKKIELENYRPKRNCAVNEVECMNSYNHTICVKEEVKDVACAQYSKRLCYGDEFHMHVCKTDSYYNKHTFSR